MTKQQYRNDFLRELADLMDKYRVYITPYEPEGDFRHIEFDIGCPVNGTRQDIEIVGAAIHCEEVRGYIHD